MAKKDYQSPPSLDASEQAIVDLVRIGLRGDSGSVRQLARRMLRRQAAEDFSPALRERLGSLIVGQADPILRGARPPMPIDSDGQLALASIDDAPDDDPPILSADTHSALAALIDQRQRANRLAEIGLEPPKTLLLEGPPGVGKTLTARYLAAQLDLPLMTVELAALMSSLLGQTGQNLHQLLDHARSFPCVLLLDEFDAVAKRRDDQSDIGELKRLVNVLLLELERWPQTGLLVAATNHPQLLDPAVGRRFDVTLALASPGQDERMAILSRALRRFRLELPDEILAASALALEGATGADLERHASAAARTVILDGSDPSRVVADIAVQGLRDDADRDPHRRAAFCAMATRHLGLSQRAVADMLGITHPTVGKLARKWEREQRVAQNASPVAA